MTHEEAFLKAILDDPDDDAPRLLMADWLEERGDLRGEFIRVQCRLHHLLHDEGEQAFLQAHIGSLRRRERELLSVGGRVFDWFGDWTWLVIPGMPALHHQGKGKLIIYHNRLCDSTWTITFSRGFVEEIACTADDFLTVEQSLLKQTTLRRVNLTTLPLLHYVQDHGDFLHSLTRPRSAEPKPKLHYVRLDSPLYGEVRPVTNRLLHDEWPELDFRLPTVGFYPENYPHGIAVRPGGN